MTKRGQLELFQKKIRTLKYRKKFYDARNCLKAGSYKMALKLYDESIKLKPDFSHAWRERGVVLSEIGCKREACNSFKQARA